MIYCEKNTAEYIGDDYSSSERPFTITYGWVAEITNVDKKHRETVQSASVTDFEQIVQMIYDDEDIGKSYNKNDLAEQLLQRSKEGYSRNYVIFPTIIRQSLTKNYLKRCRLCSADSPCRPRKPGSTH